jgi:hypothetical protein
VFSSSAFCATARHGLGAAAVAGRIKPLCKRFDDLCAQDYPIGCIGYSYCLERIAALKDKTDIEKVRTLCPEWRRCDPLSQKSQLPWKRGLARR